MSSCNSDARGSERTAFRYHLESLIGKLRDELINREIFTKLLEAKILIGNWRKEYNQIRPHSSLGYRPPTPEPSSQL